MPALKPCYSWLSASWHGIKLGNRLFPYSEQLFFVGGVLYTARAMGYMRRMRRICPHPLYTARAMGYRMQANVQHAGQLYTARAMGYFQIRRILRICQLYTARAMGYLFWQMSTMVDMFYTQDKLDA